MVQSMRGLEASQRVEGQGCIKATPHEPQASSWCWNREQLPTALHTLLHTLRKTRGPGLIPAEVNPVLGQAWSCGR